LTFFEDPASKGDVFNTTELRKIHLKLTEKVSQLVPVARRTRSGGSVTRAADARYVLCGEEENEIIRASW
jgi:hypothetical protein